MGEKEGMKFKDDSTLQQICIEVLTKSGYSHEYAKFAVRKIAMDGSNNPLGEVMDMIAVRNGVKVGLLVICALPFLWLGGIVLKRFGFFLTHHQFFSN